VGKALAGGRRDDVILATKFHGAMGDDPNRQGSSRRWIIAEVENSLRRLGTDWIDLYQVHRPQTDTDIEETLSALTDPVHQGKVRYMGSSTFPGSQIVEAQWVARERNLQRFVTEQPAYSILVRAIEADILPTVTRHGTGVLSCSPLTGGWLSGRWRKDGGQVSSSRASRLLERFDITTPDNRVGPHRRDRRAGTTINPVDNSFENPALSPTTRRTSGDAPTSRPGTAVS
jgi:aryl-alcohol dehydrogenase-like predicted oxidoreductase